MEDVSVSGEENIVKDQVTCSANIVFFESTNLN